jgi:hypothetical protein
VGSVTSLNFIAFLLWLLGPLLKAHFFFFFLWYSGFSSGLHACLGGGATCAAPPALVCFEYFQIGF